MNFLNFYCIFYLLEQLIILAITLKSYNRRLSSEAIEVADEEDFDTNYPYLPDISASIMNVLNESLK